MAAKFPSDVEDKSSSEYTIRLCASDQQNSGSCISSKCSDFHLCRDYLLTNKCSEFESNGKCLRSHSLFTLHNQRIVQEKLKLSLEDDKIFDIVAKRIGSFEEKPRPLDRFTSTGDDDDYGSHSKDKKTSTSSVVFRSNKAPFSTRLPLSTADDSHIMLTNSSVSSQDSRSFSTSLNIDLNNKKKLSTTQSLSLMESDESGSRLLRFQAADNDGDSASAASKTSRFNTFRASPVQTVVRFAKDVFSSKGDSSSKSKNEEQLKYIFHQYTQKEQLSYLFGPTRRYLTETKKYQIFPSGYCRITSADQEKDIEQRLQTALPIILKTAQVQLQYQELAFLLCTSAAEKFLENQITCGIMSQSFDASLPIEVTSMSKMNPSRPSSASVAASPRRPLITTRLTTDEQTDQSTPVEKFRISKTNSSIDVIQGDITATKVDLMVCVTTSKTLLESTLRRAGRSTEAEFAKEQSSEKSVILRGGGTSAQQILFMPWKLKINLKDAARVQESLGQFVEQCIDVAKTIQVKSIAFPSIGAGELGLGVDKVCEAMFAATINRLKLCTMDVLFVIYPSKKTDHGPQPYEIFRNYLNNLCKEGRSTKPDVHSISTNPQTMTNGHECKHELRRNVECKNIYTVSDSTDASTDHHALKDQLGRLIVKKECHLKDIQKSYIEEVDSLVDVCIHNHVWPRIDLIKNELILRGDAESCSQCFANLRNERLVYLYGYFDKMQPSDKTLFNVYMSLKIDEAYANKEACIRIEDNSRTNYRIDLHSFAIEINDDSRQFELYREPLIVKSNCLPPSTWSPSVIIRTTEVPRSSYQSLHCVCNFEATMSRAEWEILQIHAIENWPLYAHYTNSKISDDDEVLAFQGCSFSSVQSIIHYGLHSNHAQPPENSIRIARHALGSHIFDSRRATDGKYYMFVVEIAKKSFNNDLAHLTNENAHLALPTHLIVYERK